MELLSSSVHWCRQFLEDQRGKGNGAAIPSEVVKACSEAVAAGQCGWTQQQSWRCGLADDKPWHSSPLSWASFSLSLPNVSMKDQAGRPCLGHSILHSVCQASEMSNKFVRWIKSFLVHCPCFSCYYNGVADGKKKRKKKKSCELKEVTHDWVLNDKPEV